MGKYIVVWAVISQLTLVVVVAMNAHAHSQELKLVTSSWPLMLILFHGAMAFYFLRRGDFFVSLISTEESHAEPMEEKYNWDEEI